MQDLKIALVQAHQLWEDKAGNQDHFRRLLSSIQESVDLIILPEMFDTGFSMNTSLAEEWPGTSSLVFLKELARQYDAALYTSVMCKESDCFYNRGIFVFPEGSAEVYDKRKTFGLAGEDNIYTAGTKETIVEFRGWKIQLQVCYDLRFPEICRNRIANDGSAAYDLIVYVANWPEKRSVHWKTLLQARAIENQCYVAGVNRVGWDGKQLNYTGDSCVVDALGNVNTCVPGEEIVKIIRLSVPELFDIRQSLPFLKDR